MTEKGGTFVLSFTTRKKEAAQSLVGAEFTHLFNSLCSLNILSPASIQGLANEEPAIWHSPLPATMRHHRLMENYPWVVALIISSSSFGLLARK